MTERTHTHTYKSSHDHVLLLTPFTIISAHVQKLFGQILLTPTKMLNPLLHMCHVALKKNILAYTYIQNIDQML